jgi:predicted tellurium resistance membrane protein TerC
MTVMGWALTMILLSLSSWNRGGAHAFSSSRWVFLPAQQQQQRRGWRSVSSNSDLLLFRHPKSSSLATRSTTTTNHDPNENSSTPPSSSIHETSSSSSSVTAPPHLTAANAPPFRVTIEDEDYSYGDAVRRTLAWVGAAILFGSTLWATAGTTTGEEFFAGYLVEQSLSVDNLFVFLLLFEYFKVPLQYQDRVLNWGIYGAIIMRAIMIGLGAVALQQFHAILLVFAAILVYSSAKFFVGIVGGDDEEDEDDPANNAIVQFSKTLVHTSDHYDGDRFFTVVEGVRKATPLFLCMVAVEISDVVFAVDSIPAVFGVTEVRSFVRSFVRLFGREAL